MGIVLERLNLILWLFFKKMLQIFFILFSAWDGNSTSSHLMLSACEHALRPYEYLVVCERTCTCTCWNYRYAYRFVLKDIAEKICVKKTNFDLLIGILREFIFTFIQQVAKLLHLYRWMDRLVTLCLVTKPPSQNKVVLVDALEPEVQLSVQDLRAPPRPCFAAQKFGRRRLQV